MIRYTAHALLAMAERGLERVWVEPAVRTPDWTETEPSDSGLMRSFKRIPEKDGRALRVVHRHDGSDIVVVTAFFDRGAGR